MANRSGFKRIEVEVPEDLAEEITAFAKSHGLSVSAFFRYAVLEEMNRG